MTGPSGVPADYDPSLEWPGDDEDLPSSAHAGPSTRPAPLLRLLVLRTSVLPAKHALAASDGFTSLEFGRDLAPSQDVPRIRLKEMEVSKLHATAYLDRDSWYLVDMGSKHGTFLQLTTNEKPARLSPPRVASVPRQLHHLDALAIGSTTFLVHIHEGAPCEDCSTDNTIPLFLKPKAPPKADGYLRATSTDPKKALSTLKQQLLAPRHGAATKSEASSYTDRSARRRSLHPASRLDAPGVAPVLPVVSSATPAEVWEPPVAVTTSQPPTPLPATNVGHRLLMGQGWTPGSSLGQNWDGADGLIEPLDVASNSRRAGLGMPKSRK
ncbi:hypothetical protein FB45DRAFT_887757 [Roridomyces roridus]|uniref:Angiogenic factor with G patch and FHA domains 1 n=1 Tax=Roridomyces roridus TaxID=1738132 RepID=A0AAD7FYT7_9AGAR|nr:hypothetical protein FB45DRAFT_887757 [Roridomyces roridus]